MTSYEYADLHQLSSLWLGYTEDYRDLRKGSIGSIYNSDDFIVDVQKLNKTGKSVVTNLENVGMPKSKVKSVARYYSDMQDAIEKCYGMLSDTGMIFFVVGDTEYKGIKILNSKHLVETLFDQKEFVYHIGMSKESLQKINQKERFIMKNLLSVGGLRNEFRYYWRKNR